MASIYILFSKTLNRFYTGSCDDLSVRLEQHLNKTFTNSFTSKAEDWEVFYTLDNLNYQEARNIEAHIKRMKSKTYIANLKQYPETSAKLIERYR